MVNDAVKRAKLIFDFNKYIVKYKDPKQFLIQNYY